MAAESDQAREIAAFKAGYNGTVRVIQGVGDFSHVVTVQPAGQDLYCKFQLTDSYPESAPIVNIRSSALPDDLVVALTSDLQDMAKGQIGNPMIGFLMEAVRKWVSDKDVDLTPHTELKDGSKRGGKGKGRQRTDGAKSKARQEQDGVSEKKSSMKTAADVIKRIQWDESLPVEDFIVGYIDRFTGIVENSFTDFSWEDLASADQFSLAIPQHRIQYFKYKTEKIWDKNERLDNVFGSTGSNKTIADVIKNYTERVSAVVEDGADDVDEPEGAVGDCVGEGFEAATSSLPEKVQENVRICEDSKKKPDYFLALRITDDEVIKKLTELQEELRKHYPHFAAHAVSRTSFHLTLTVLSMESSENVRRCVDLLEKEKSRMSKLAKDSGALEITGVDHFYNTVIFAKVKYSREFLRFVDTLKTIFSEAGLNIHTDHGFNPHITLFKVNRTASRDKSWPKESLSLVPFSREFGCQPADNLHLCQMGSLLEGSDFYTTAASYSFTV